MAGMAGTVVYLCSFVVPRLDSSFVSENYGEIYARLPTLLRESVTDAPLMRASLGCLRYVLGAFSDEASWKEKESLQELLAAVLNLCLDERPKVRRAAQDCVCGLLSSAEGRIHPALAIVAQFCRLVLQGSTRKESGRAMHLAPLMRRLVPCLDQSSIDGFVGPVLQCCGLGNTHLTVALFGFITELTRVKGEEDEELVRLVQLNLSQTKKMHEGLLRLQPASWELADLSAAWISATGQVLAHPAMSKNTSGSTAQILLSGLDSSMEPVHVAVQLAFSRLQVDETLLLEALQKVTVERISVLPYLLAIIRDQVMLGSGRGDLELTEVRAQNLVLISSLYDKRGFASVRGDLTKAIGDFVRVYGASAVLSAIPLGMESPGVSRAWLLPVLKDSVSNDSLALLVDELLPLADRLQAKADSFRAQEKIGDAKVYETIVFQIWSLVPSFLRYPVDAASVFPRLAPKLAARITSDPLLRPLLVNGLTGFVRRTLRYEDDIDSGDLTLLRPLSSTSGDLEMLRGLVGNLLPVLFNLLGVTVADQRAYLLDAVRSLLDLCPVAMVMDYFGKVIGAAQSDQMVSSRAALIELLCTMLPVLDLPAHTALFNLALPLLQQEDSGLQKAAYKALHLIMSHEMFGPALLNDPEQLVVLEQNLLAAGEATEIGAVRKCRFRLLLGLLPQLPDNSLHWIPALLPETVLGTKEVNQKARLLSFELLLAMARRMSRGGVLLAAHVPGLPADTPASIDEFLTMVLAGLAGKTPHMISATVLALARLLFELGPSLPVPTIHALLGDVLLLFGSPSREIVKAAFGFVKVAVVAALPSESISPEHLRLLVSSILAWSDEHAMHFKVRVRHLLERLVRRFGYEAIEACVPAEHHRLIVNIRKRKERLRRRKAEQSADGGEMEEGDDVDMDAITQAALSKQTSMMTRRGISSSAQATRPSAKFEAALYDSESDLEDDEHEEEERNTDANMLGGDDDDLEKALSRKLTVARTAKTITKTLKKNTGLDTQMSKKPAVKPTKNARNDEDFRTNPEGKMIIQDTDDEFVDDEGVLIDDSAHKLYEQSLNTFQRPGKHVKFSQKKRQLEDDQEDDNDVAYDQKSKMSRLSRLTKVTSRPQAVGGKHSGREYSAKKGAKGDVQSKKSKFEPYAYVPLQRAAKGAKSNGRYYMTKKN